MGSLLKLYLERRKRMKRQEYNRKILEKLTKVVDENPELRFSQILHVLGADEMLFYEESETTYKLLKWDQFGE
jgi:hypothetical protein